MAWCLATWFIRVPLSGPGASIITWNFLRKRQLPTMTSSNPVPRILGLSGQWVSARWDPGKTMPFSRKTGSSKKFECYHFRSSGYDWTSIKSTSFPESLLLYFHGNEAGAKSLTPFALCGKNRWPMGESRYITQLCFGLFPHLLSRIWDCPPPNITEYRQKKFCFVMMRVNYTNVGIAISLLVVCFIFFRLAQRSHLLETQLRSTVGK